jgi:chromosome segregation ATPase
MNEPKSATDITPSQATVPPAPSPVRQLGPWLLAGALAISLGVNYVQAQKTSTLSSDIGTLRNEMATVRSNIKTAEESMQRSLTGVAESLAATKQEVDRKVAQQSRVVVHKQTTQLDKKWQQEQAALVERLNADLATLRESAQAASTKISDINTEVGTVKTDVGNVKLEVASTRGELDRTVNDLKRVRGDMGEMSGYIATNSKELNALKELGERNYYEFNLAKSAGQQRVGDIQMVVRKADLKKARYTIDVVVDDKKIEKKDKTVSEPVQFYVSSKSRQAYELVVYEVQKDRIIGYLATPKVQVARK